MNPMYEFIQKNRAIAKIEKAISTMTPHLILDDLDIHAVPDDLFSCQQLTSLHLGHNKLQAVPIRLSELNNLQNLFLECNSIVDFPSILKDLKHLKTLNISNNPLRSLENVGKLTNLEVLWCNNCCLSSVPEEIGNLVKLETLGLRHNSISNLPESISNLTNLSWLTLEDNKLHLLPKGFENLVQLIHLNLNKNNFSDIPIQLTKLLNLRFLHLKSNEFFSIPETIVLRMLHVKINLMQNPLSSFKDTETVFPNLILPGGKQDEIDDLLLDSDTSSNDWENSLNSSELNFGMSDMENEEEEILTELPRLSKFLVTF